MEETKITYFQYQKDLDLPLYIRLNLDGLTSEIIKLLAQMRFQELSSKEGEGVLKRVQKEHGGRLLTLEEASPALAKQIDFVKETDAYGDESLVPGYGYRVYRYKGVAIMPYSYQSPHWSLGHFLDFGSSEKMLPSKIVINRFLSYALAPLGIVGLWGTFIDDGLALLKPGESRGEAIFIDVREKKTISVNGVKKINPQLKILRFDSELTKREIPMTPEELLVFLFSHTTYFDYEGLIVPVRQGLQAFSKMVNGIVCPRKMPPSRADLSL